MIIAQLIGGLGNQMFQYAAGRALSLKNDTSLLLDISAYETNNIHQGFELQRIFSCPAETASKSDLCRVLGWQSLASVRRIVSRRPFSIFSRKSFVAEPHFHYWPGIKSISKSCYLSGYWQSEKYFSDASSQIREDFKFRLPLADQNAVLGKQIYQVNAVSLHVRRGDYALNMKTMTTHGLCSPEYYRRAVQYLADRVEQPHFYIFSDDIDWVKDNLRIDFPTVYVQHNRGKESYNDMRLMSLCRHHIIANSSFSWWGAWLNPDMKKIVVAPGKWFANQTDVRDLLPEGWVIL